MEGEPAETLRDVPGAARYELRRGGELLAQLDYHLTGDRIALVHAETAPAHLGRGLAGRVTRFALDDARARGRSVAPRCPFVADWIARHPDYADLIQMDPPAPRRPHRA